MKLLAWIGCLITGIIAVVLGNFAWSVISVAITEKLNPNSLIPKEGE